MANTREMDRKAPKKGPSFSSHRYSGYSNNVQRQFPIIYPGMCQLDTTELGLRENKPSLFWLPSACNEYA